MRSSGQSIDNAGIGRELSALADDVQRLQRRRRRITRRFAGLLRKYRAPAVAWAILIAFAYVTFFDA